MHITFNTSERDDVRKLSLPEGTTLVESDANDGLVASWVCKGNLLVLVKDFVEQDRPWKKGEREAFSEGMTRERVFDYFLYHNDSGPQREYSAMSSAEYDVLKFIRHSGSYIPEGNKKYNLFKISLNKDSNIEEAEKEVSWALERIVKAHPKRESYQLEIFEHTLSEYGIYSLDWDGNNTFKLMKCTYGRNEELKSFDSLRSTLEYIAKNHFYEKKTE